MCVWRAAADYMISAVCSPTGVRGAPGGGGRAQGGQTIQTMLWKSVEKLNKKCDGAVSAV